MQLCVHVGQALQNYTEVILQVFEPNFKSCFYLQIHCSSDEILFTAC